MSLYDQFERQGEWLFKWRSYLPLAFVLLFVVALHDYRWPFNDYHDYQLWAEFSFAISLVGVVIRCATVGYAPAKTSGRNSSRQIADTLNTTGMYSLVRHPLYLGNFLIGLGPCLSPGVWWLPTLYCLLFCCYYERIMFTEEAFLRRKFGEKFEKWAAATPAFIPRIVGWREPELPFSLRTVLRREYTGLAVAVYGNAAVQFTAHLIIDRRVVYEVFWVTLLITGGVAYFGLRILKNRTTLLDVQGR